MAVVTKLNGTDITTYKLHLKSFNGQHDLPARKKTTEVWNFTTDDIMFEDKKIVFEFVGIYNDALDLGTCIALFTSNVLSALEGTISVRVKEDLYHPTETYIGRLVNGAKINILMNHVVFITLEMTWQGKTVK